MAGGKKSEGTTRREFLVGTGATLAFGVTSGLSGCGDSTSIAEPKYQVTSRIEHDSSLCAGCSVCSLMCSLFHEGDTIVALSRNEIVRDPFDGSYEVMIIESSYPHFSYTDFGATACGTDGDGSPLYPAVIEGDPVISGDTLTVSGMVVCMGDSPYFLLPDPFVLVFTYDKQSDTIGSDMPSFTETWTRIGKK